jgi:hypothetical protein
MPPSAGHPDTGQWTLCVDDAGHDDADRHSVGGCSRYTGMVRHDALCVFGGHAFGNVNGERWFPRQAAAVTGCGREPDTLDIAEPSRSCEMACPAARSCATPCFGAETTVRASLAVRR